MTTKLENLRPTTPLPKKIVRQAEERIKKRKIRMEKHQMNTDKKT